MSLLSRAWDSVVSVFHKASDNFPALIAKLKGVLADFDLSAEHIAAIKGEVVAVEKAFGGSVNGFVKAGKVADAVGKLTGDLKLPEATNGFIGTVISAVHAIATMEQLIVNTPAKK